jgi:hypothetical protein
VRLPSRLCVVAVVISIANCSAPSRLPRQTPDGATPSLPRQEAIHVTHGATPDAAIAAFHQYLLTNILLVTHESSIKVYASAQIGNRLFLVYSYAHLGDVTRGFASLIEKSGEWTLGEDPPGIWATLPPKGGGGAPLIPLSAGVDLWAYGGYVDPHLDSVTSSTLAGESDTSAVAPTGAVIVMAWTGGQVTSASGDCVTTATSVPAYDTLASSLFPGGVTPSPDRSTEDATVATDFINAVLEGRPSDAEPEVLPAVGPQPFVALLIQVLEGAHRSVSGSAIPRGYVFRFNLTGPGPTFIDLSTTEPYSGSIWDYQLFQRC